jgi:rubrerythrin
MATKCPKCHEFVEEDYICCAEVKFTWKCTDCSKLSTGFVLPYGRCHLCGGKLERVEEHKFDDPERMEPILQAVQFELDSYHFYSIASERTKEPRVKDLLEDLAEMELAHLEALEDKYHVLVEDRRLQVPQEKIDSILFSGITFSDDDGHLEGIYNKAIEVEKRNRDIFLKMAEGATGTAEADLCRELAAEEEEHIAILETELQTLS